MTASLLIRNPHLEGSSFYWKASPTGILLCHGFTATTAEVRLLAKTLFGHGYTIAGPLLPGHGTSPQDCNRYTWEDWYNALEQAYLQLASQCQTVVVGGESTGALLALYLAYQHPEVAGILCYAPALRLTMSKGKVSLLAFLKPFLTSIPKAPPADNNPWQGYSVIPLKAAGQLLRLQRAITPSLPSIRRPTLIIQGRLDPTVHPAVPRVIYDQIGSAYKEIHWLENSTHCVILDKERDLAAQLTLDFLGRVLE